MATQDPIQPQLNYLIARLAKIADTAENHADGTSRIKAAVMASYLAGRPVPTKEPALTGFLALQREFGIQLTGEGS